MSKGPKITTSELVLSAIFFLQQKQGVTSRDITKFICEKRGCKQGQVREEIKKALEKATKKGIFEKKRGLYRIKSTFGKNIIAEIVKNFEGKNKAESPNLEEADMGVSPGDDFERNFFKADFFRGQTPWTKNAEFEGTEPFQNAIYLRENEDDFEVQSGENISVERLRGPRSDDDDEDFLEEDEYDDDEIDFFADDQFPTAEEALRTPRNSSTESTNVKYANSEDDKPRRRTRHSKKHSKRHRTARAEITNEDENEVIDFEDDDEEEDDDNNKETTTGQRLKKEVKEKENKKMKGKTEQLKEQKLKEQNRERNESMESESNETLAKSLKLSQEFNDGEELYSKNGFKNQNFGLSCNDKYQKHYNSKETNRKNENNKRSKSSNTKFNIKLEPSESSDYENMESSLRSEAQEALSDPENCENKSKRERFSSLYGPSSSTFKRKVAGDSKPIKHRKFN